MADPLDYTVCLQLFNNTQPRCSACERYIMTDTIACEIVVCADGTLEAYHPTCHTLRVEDWLLLYPWEHAGANKHKG